MPSTMLCWFTVAKMVCDGVNTRPRQTGYRFPLHERMVELFRRRLSIDAVINYFLCFFLDPFFFLATLDPFLGASSSINGLCAMNAGLFAPTNDSFGVWSGGIFDPMAVRRRRYDPSNVPPFQTVFKVPVNRPLKVPSCESWLS